MMIENIGVGRPMPAALRRMINQKEAFVESRTVMRRGDSGGKPVSNRILLSLPDVEYRQIRAHLEFVKLEPYRVLHEPGEKLCFAYFLNSGLASLLAMMREGKAVEAGVVGLKASWVPPSQ